MDFDAAVHVGLLPVPDAEYKYLMASSIKRLSKFSNKGADSAMRVRRIFITN
jgi:hypothetical protein